MKCRTRSEHRISVPLTKANEMVCALCGEVVPWKPTLRDRWHALRERLAAWIAP